MCPLSAGRPQRLPAAPGPASPSAVAPTSPPRLPSPSAPLGLLRSQLQASQVSHLGLVLTHASQVPLCPRGAKHLSRVDPLGPGSRGCGLRSGVGLGRAGGSLHLPSEQPRESFWKRWAFECEECVVKIRLEHELPSITQLASIPFHPYTPLPEPTSC